MFPGGLFSYVMLGLFLIYFKSGTIHVYYSDPERVPGEKWLRPVAPHELDGKKLVNLDNIVYTSQPNNQRMYV